MAAGKKKNQTPAQSESELRDRVWSVISFDKCEARGLTYAEAEQKLSELEAQKVAGLCIVPDEVAARIEG
jgi:hypothetical protein